MKDVDGFYDMLISDEIHDHDDDTDLDYSSRYEWVCSTSQPEPGSQDDYREHDSFSSSAHTHQSSLSHTVRSSQRSSPTTIHTNHHDLSAEVNTHNVVHAL